MNKLLILVFSVLLFSCKTKKIATETTPTTEPVIIKNIATETKPEAKSEQLNVRKVIDRHYDNKIDFKTLYIKSDINYKDNNKEQSASVEIKIQKDKIILISVRFLGFTVAKGLITPKEVSYYSKIGSKYFVGDFKMLSRWLGTDLDFQKVQNLLIGKPIDNLNRGGHLMNIVGNNYEIQEKRPDENINKVFTISTTDFLLLKQIIEQTDKDRKMTVDYDAYQKHNEMFLPNIINIEASQNQNKTIINIEYKSISVDEELTFPYAVPSGYSKMELKNGE